VNKKGYYPDGRAKESSKKKTEKERTSFCEQKEAKKLC
jgi:hypothetical protein